MKKLLFGKVIALFTSLSLYGMELSPPNVFLEVHNNTAVNYEICKVYEQINLTFKPLCLKSQWIGSVPAKGSRTFTTPLAFEQNFKRDLVSYLSIREKFTTKLLFRVLHTKVLPTYSRVNFQTYDAQTYANTGDLVGEYCSYSTNYLVRFYINNSDLFTANLAFDEIPVP